MRVVGLVQCKSFRENLEQPGVRVELCRKLGDGVKKAA
jgi:hypothetical protein